MIINIWFSIKDWFYIHFNKETYNLMKVYWKGKPWNYNYLYELEQAKLKEMLAHYKRDKRCIKTKKDIKLMELCIKLIDIFLEKKSLYHVISKSKNCLAEEIPPLDMDGKDLEYCCDVNVNTQNVDRFAHNRFEKRLFLLFPSDLYKQKAKLLYHKIRYRVDSKWRY